MTDLRCWWCGVEPDTILEHWQLDQSQPQLVPVWPAGDHQHTATPPTPEQLAQQGHTTWRRIMEAS